MPAPKASQPQKKRKKDHQDCPVINNKDTKRTETTEIVQASAKTDSTDTAEKKQVVAPATEQQEAEKTEIVDSVKELQEAKLSAQPVESAQPVLPAPALAEGDSDPQETKNEPEDNKKEGSTFQFDISKWFKDSNNMDYLQYKAMMEAEYSGAPVDVGLNPWREEAGTYNVEQPWHGGDTFSASRVMHGAK